MNERSESTAAGHTVRKTAIEAACEAMRLYAMSIGESQTFGDLMLFEWAREAEMSPSGKASEYLDHFLFGGGETKTFETAHLLNEDPGVRRRVSGVITAALRTNPNLLTTPKNRSGGEYVAAVRQGDRPIDVRR